MGFLPTPWNCISNRIAIICHLQENLTSLRQTRDELENISKDVRSNIKGEREIQKKCLGSCGPRNCYSSYKLGKEVNKGTEAVKDLINKGKEFKSLDDVSEKLPPHPVDEISVKKTLGMDSILDEVWSCLDDHEVSAIGIYGIGGVGKTTRLQKLSNKFIDKRRDFDLVIWVTVSKEVNLNRIQEVIRNKLDIPEGKWKSKIDEHGRAAEIFRSLCRKKFVLLLDDLWERNQRIDLLDMGVPDLSCHQNGSKILFTTRSADVCHSMDAAVKKFEVKCLSFDESFELFRRCVTDEVLNSHHQITKFAETVAKKCKEDHMIRKDEVIDLWIAEGILHNYGLNDTRDAGEFIIRSLKHASLLEKVGDSDDYVKMHDVLRDMALWLASVKENKIFVFENQESIKKHGIATWKEATSIDTFPSPFFQSMHAMKVLELSKHLFLTRLPAMLEMINLPYLNSSDTDIEELPIMANSWTKLRFLLLDGTRGLKAIPEGVISSLSSLLVFGRVPTKNGRLYFQPFWNTILLQELECLEDIEEISVTLFTVDAVFQLKSSSSVLSSSRFDNLHDLYINNCLIKDLACVRYATRLRFIFAGNCPLLEEIIPYEFSSSSGDLNMFENLKQMNFSDLPLLKSICRVMHLPSLETIHVDNCPSLTKLSLDVFNENNSRISILGHKEWWEELEWENSSSKVSSPSMHQTAQYCSDNFPHFKEAVWRYSDNPSYTYEATVFESTIEEKIFEFSVRAVRYIREKYAARCPRARVQPG
ncbi:probable disease resistance protein At4g14610 [Pistacia vera]|uniref:probable disease resistance protein At4g14610 n=1 Tax=Pistacia vera TaxID=55513 RepID=UPI0012630A22|nr:probable disease resistance protein At4g14610 [Pistacia vera]